MVRVTSGPRLGHLPITQRVDTDWGSGTGALCRSLGGGATWGVSPRRLVRNLTSSQELKLVTEDGRTRGIPGCDRPMSEIRGKRFRNSDLWGYQSVRFRSSPLDPQSESEIDARTAPNSRSVGPVANHPNGNSNRRLVRIGYGCENTMHCGTVDGGRSQIRHHVRSRVLHPEVRLAIRPDPPVERYLEPEGRPQPRLPDAEEKQRRAAASCGWLDCAPLCNRGFAKGRGDGSA
jgi:hypothetical protein